MMDFDIKLIAFWVAQGGFSAICVIVAAALIMAILMASRLSAAKENRPGFLIFAVSIVTFVLTAIFFREDQANALTRAVPAYDRFVAWAFELSNSKSPATDVYSYFGLFVASSSLFTVLAGLVSLAVSFYWFGFGGEWSLRGANISRDRVSINAKNALTFGKTKVPVEVETRGFALFGTTGTGKSQAITQILSTARKRGQRAVIVDPGGEMMSRLWQPGDVILSPEDERSENWSIWADMKFDDECLEFAESVIDPGKGESEKWHQDARTLLQVFFEYLFKNQLRKNKYVTNLLRMSDEELAEVVKDSVTARVVTGSNTKGRDSILSIISLALKPWERLNPESGVKDFSIREFLHGKHDRWLWLPYSQNSGKTYEPLRRMWIDIAVRAVLTGKEDKDQRVWLSLDELHNQGRLDVLSMATAMGRKFGLAHVLGIHSISQLREIYGRDGAQSILSTTGNQLILRAADADTAEYCSQQIGDRENQRKERSESRGESGRSENLQYQRHIDRAVLPSEILNLPDLEGYFLFSGRGQRRVKLDYLGDIFPANFDPLIRKSSSSISRPEYVPLKELIMRSINSEDDTETAPKLKLKKTETEPETDA